MRMVAPAVGLAAAMAVGAVVAAADGLGTADGATARVGAAVETGAQAAMTRARTASNTPATRTGRSSNGGYCTRFGSCIQSLTFLNSSSLMDQLLTTIHTAGGPQIFPKIAPQRRRE